MSNLTVTPMVHVPDVEATVDWYRSVGFSLDGTNKDDGKLNWALMSFGEGQVMFNGGGGKAANGRRELDLYVHTDDVDNLYLTLKDRISIIEHIHDTFYGMREFIARDLNGFWVTFGQDVND